MLADIADGKLDAVVAWDLDRLHRRPVELEAFIDVADRHRLALATVSGDVDLSTPQGRLVARLKGSVARHEVEHKSARQRRAMEQLAARGVPKWRRAFGYLDDGSHQLDPATAPLVAEAYRAILAGGSISDIARDWNAAGAHGLNGKPWTASTVSLFLRAPRNAALRAHRGEIVGAGTWPPLVDESTWRAAQAVLNAPGRAPGRKSVRKHPLTGVLQCGNDGCSGTLSGSWVMQPTGGTSGRPRNGETKKHPGKVAHSITYVCKTCRGCSIRADYVEPLLYRIVSGRLTMPDAVDLLKSEMHDEAEAEALRGEANTLLTRLDEIADERADGLLTGPQARRATERIQARLDEIEQRQQDQERLRVFDGIPLGTPQAANAIRNLSPDRFRAALAVLAEFVVAPVGKGGRIFNPERVKVNWR